MLQVDLLLSYGLSSGIALATKRKLTLEKNPWLNKYFLMTLLWLTLLFTPQVIYLLWRFPGWESMFVVTSYSEIPAWFVSAISIGITVFGILGFWLTNHLLKKGNSLCAITLLILSLVATLSLLTYGWDGTGYKRLLYAGTGVDWANGITYQINDFIGSPVFYTLLWLEAFVVIPYGLLMAVWIREK